MGGGGDRPGWRRVMDHSTTRKKWRIFFPRLRHSLSSSPATSLHYHISPPLAKAKADTHTGGSRKWILIGWAQGTSGSGRARARHAPFTMRVFQRRPAVGGRPPPLTTTPPFPRKLLLLLFLFVCLMMWRIKGGRRVAVFHSSMKTQSKATGFEPPPKMASPCMLLDDLYLDSL